MSDFTPTLAPEGRSRCQWCGSRVTHAGLTPGICIVCKDCPPAGPPWQPGEVGYELSMSADRAEQLSGIRPRVDPFVLGPLRSRETAEELAKLWGATVSEVVVVPAPQPAMVGRDMVTT